jgi:hypothetical protein
VSVCVCVCECVCVCVCARARVCVCVCVCCYALHRHLEVRLADLSLRDLALGSVEAKRFVGLLHRHGLGFLLNLNLPLVKHVLEQLDVVRNGPCREPHLVCRTIGGVSERVERCCECAV